MQRACTPTTAATRSSSCATDSCTSAWRCIRKRVARASGWRPTSRASTTFASCSSSCTTWRWSTASRTCSTVSFKPWSSSSPWIPCKCMYSLLTSIQHLQLRSLPLTFSRLFSTFDRLLLFPIDCASRILAPQLLRSPSLTPFHFGRGNLMRGTDKVRSLTVYRLNYQPAVCNCRFTTTVFLWVRSVACYCCYHARPHVHMDVSHQNAAAVVCEHLVSCDVSLVGRSWRQRRCVSCGQAH